MRYIAAVICLCAGVACLVWFKTLRRAYSEFMAERFREKFGSFATYMTWDDPNSKALSLNYTLGLIGLTLFFIALAAKLVFGTIRLDY